MNNKNIIGKIVWVNNALYKVIDCYDGDVDLSYHGSPYYEQFIVAEPILCGSKITFGSEHYTWHIAEDYIMWLENNRKEVKKQLESLCWKL